ncbi:hypothetical protein ABVT39_007653 [Epinephelus coioides]
MDDSTNVSCVLCRRSKETKITGPLSTKDEVTAHQNCLLFSSGIICQSTPQHDDLFGFSVEDVLCEVQRGKRLVCKRCDKSGATAGCEVKRCKKSYHYPCAVKDKAIIIEDTKEEKYVLYCPKHDPKAQENNGSVNGRPSSHTKSRTSKTPSEPRSDKVYCLACDETEGSISLDSLSDNAVRLYCDKHAPSSHKRNSNGKSCSERTCFKLFFVLISHIKYLFLTGCAKAPRPLSAFSSDSSSSNNATPSSSKRRCEPSNKQDETPSKRKFKSPRVIQTDDSSDSDDSIPDSDMAIFAPLETDLESCVNSVYEPEMCNVQMVCKLLLSLTESQPEEERGDGSEDDTMIHSDAESQSLLSPVSQRRPTTVATVSTQTSPPALPDKDLIKTEGSTPEQAPVQSPDQHTAEPSVPQQSPAGPPPSCDPSKPRSVTASPPCTTSATSPAPPEIVHVTVMLPPSPSPSPSPPMGPPSDPEPTVNATSFWRSCNAAGCTQAIFTGFINKMNDISSRIQSDQASQEDYDFALSVMTVSGKLAELVAKQQEEIQRKQVELQKAAAAMEKVISTLRDVHQQLQ